jgi:hypothetical protein
MSKRSGSRTLRLTYLGDASQLSKTTKDAGNEISSLGDRVKTVGKTLAIGFAAVGAAGLAMGRNLFQAFEEVSTANARVEQVVSSMGNFEGQLAQTTDRIIKQAEATARLTGVDRNLIKESQALLLTFDSVNRTAGEAGGVFDRATQAAVDLAAAGFGSATSNAQSLGRALEDPIRGLTSLTRQGVTFTEEQRELIRSLVESNRTLEAQGIILGAIETQVGGVAEATANGSARIAQSFGILRDRIALELGPAFEFLVDKALLFVDRFGDWWDANGDDIIQGFRNFATNVKETWEEFKTFVGLVVENLQAGGSFDKLREQAKNIAVQFDATREAFRKFRDNLVGPDAESQASAFARLIDIGYIKPIEKLLEIVEQALAILETFFRIADRVRDFLTRDTIIPSLPSGFLSPEGFGLPSSGAAPAGTSITVNVTGAIDPEGTARTVERVLADQALRSGVRPSDVRALLR